MVWNYSTGKVVHTRPSGDADGVASSPDRNHLAWTDNRTLRVLSTADWKETMNGTVANDNIEGIDWTSDSRYVGGGCAGKIRFWEVTTGNEYFTARSGTSAKFVRVRPGNEFFATTTGSANNTFIFAMGSYGGQWCVWKIGDLGGNTALHAKSSTDPVQARQEVRTRWVYFCWNTARHRGDGRSLPHGNPVRIAARGSLRNGAEATRFPVRCQRSPR